MRAAGGRRRSSGSAARLRQLDVDLVARLAREAGEAVREQVQVRADMDLVAQVTADEAVQTLRRGPSHKRREPVRDDREERHDAPQEQPHQVRQHQQDAEEDGQATALEIVGDDQLDGGAHERIRIRWRGRGWDAVASQALATPHRQTACGCDPLPVTQPSEPVSHLEGCSATLLACRRLTRDTR